MKANCFKLLMIAAFLFSCEDSIENLDSPEEISVQEIDMSDFYVRTDTSDPLAKPSNGKGAFQKCYTMNELNRQLDENPGLYQRMYNIEKHTREFIVGKKGGNGNGNGGGGNPNGGNGGGTTPPEIVGTITIPVVVHVIYGPNDVDNISEGQIRSQITILNEDFSAINSDFLSVPTDFQGVKGIADIQFTLASSDIKRVYHPNTSWPTDNSMKSVSQVVTPDTHLNIWVVNQLFSGSNSILGYAQFPGGNSSTDGIVIAHPFFGNTETVNEYYTNNPFDQGRTATHEIGHWLNLRHIWGDGRCKRDDFVSDTPSSDCPNYNCPGPETEIYHCRNRDMHMNYMDYVDDECMYMFTNGQVDRMRALFVEGGSRVNMAPTQP